MAPMKRLIAVPTALLCLAGSSAFALQVLNYFHPSGLPGVVSDARVRPAGSVAPAAGLRSPDIDLKLMAAWALRHLNVNPGPELNYEPVFFIRPMQVPPAPAGHDAIVPGDTDC